MNGHSNSSSYYSERLEAFRQSDADRDALVAEVIRKYEEIQLKYDEKCDDYNNEVESRRMWQTKAKSHEQALANHKQASGSNSFVLVVLDGDGAVFQDYLLAMGKDGGSDAAHQLHSDIKNDLRLTYPDANVDDWNVVVDVVLNMQGLANKLLACGIVANPNDVFAFARAFGLAQPLFKFIDVGAGKEHADHKIRETLRVFLPNAQCKHVYFGPCNDNGYVCVLERYKRDYASRLTLIETRPCEQGFVGLGFKRISFPRIFRTENLPAKPATITSPGPVLPPTPSSTRSSSIAQLSQMHASIAPFIPQSTSPAPSSDSATSLSTPSSTTWATVGRNGTNTKTFNIASAKKAPVRKHILLNVHDERLDVELPRSDPGAEKRFVDRLKTKGKLCNNYHLNGTCDAVEYCDYYHGERLSPGEQLVLKHKARSRTCPQRDMCRDLECTFGHHCKFGRSCSFENCWFSHTHFMDTEPAKKVFEDGSEEWLQTYLNKFST